MAEKRSRPLLQNFTENLMRFKPSSWAVIVLATLSVGREGSWKPRSLSGLPLAPLLKTLRIGTVLPLSLIAIVGILTAVLIAWAMMRGVGKINLCEVLHLDRCFTIIAAGVLSYGIHDLQGSTDTAGTEQYSIRFSRLYRTGRFPYNDPESSL